MIHILKNSTASPVKLKGETRFIRGISFPDNTHFLSKINAPVFDYSSQISDHRSMSFSDPLRFLNNIGRLLFLC